jgi:hypothetical protein
MHAAMAIPTACSRPYHHPAAAATTAAVPLCIQVLAQNHINVPNLTITFSDPDTLTLTEESKSALSVLPYKPAAEAAFGAWDTPLATPQGQLANEVPVDRTGAARSASNDLPGG